VKDPKRWLEAGSDAPSGTRELLRASSGVPPLTDAVRGRLSLFVAKTTSLPKVAASSWALGAKGMTAVGLMVAAGYGAMRLQAPAPAESAPPIESRAEARVESPPEPLPAPADLAPSPQPPPTSTSEAAPAARPQLARVSSGGRTERHTGVRSGRVPIPLNETDYLEHARALLETDAREALRLAHRHHDAFPAGRLDLEAEIIAVHALMRLGQRDAARARADAVIQKNPGSIYAERLGRLVDSQR
jgi:hypothetical protein